MREHAPKRPRFFPFRGGGNGWRGGGWIGYIGLWCFQCVPNSTTLYPIFFVPSFTLITYISPKHEDYDDIYDFRSGHLFYHFFFSCNGPIKEAHHKKKKKKSIWFWESLQLTHMKLTTILTCEPLNAGWVQTWNLANPQKIAQFQNPNKWTPGVMAHRCSPFWVLRKKGLRFKPSSLQVKFPPAHFPMSLLTRVFANGLSGLVCLCCLCFRKT